MKYIAVFDVDEKMFNYMTKEEVNNMILNDPKTEALLQNKKFTISLFDKVKVKQLPQKKDVPPNYGMMMGNPYGEGWNACIDKILGEENE